MCVGRAHVLVEVAPCLSRISRHAFILVEETRLAASNGTEMALPNYKQMFVSHIPYVILILRYMNADPRSDGQKAEGAALAHCIRHSHRRFLPHTRTMVSDYHALVKPYAHKPRLYNGSIASTLAPA